LNEYWLSSWQTQYLLRLRFLFSFWQSVKIKVVWKTGARLSKRSNLLILRLFCCLFYFLWLDWVNVNWSHNFFIRFTVFLFFIIVESKKVSTLKWCPFDLTMCLQKLYLGINQILYLLIRGFFLKAEIVNWVSNLANKRSLIN